MLQSAKMKTYMMECNLMDNIPSLFLYFIVSKPQILPTLKERVTTLTLEGEKFRAFSLLIIFNFFYTEMHT